MGLSAGCGTDGNLSEEMFHLDQPGKKSQPMGGGAVRLKYICDMKIRVVGYKAYCQGRAIGDPGSYYVVWEDGIIQTSNNLPK